MCFPQPPQKEEALVGLLDQRRGVEGPGEVLRDVDTQEFKAGDPFDLCSIDVNGSVSDRPSPPEVHNKFFGLFGVQCQVVVGTPRRNGSDTLMIFGVYLKVTQMMSKTL